METQKETHGKTLVSDGDLLGPTLCVFPLKIFVFLLVQCVSTF